MIDLVYSFVYWSVIICSGYLLLLYSFLGFLTVVALFENLRRKPESHSEDYEALLHSRFTIPVSVIVPAHNEEGMITTVVRHLLDFEYAEFEVIIVNDGSTDGTAQALEAEFALEPIELSYRRILPAKPVRAVYRSRTHAQVVLVDKEKGGKADALNCGINFAKYRYLCCVDGDTLYMRDALLAAMRLVVKDPATVLGVTSLVGVTRRLDPNDDRDVGSKTVEPYLWCNFQHLEMLRAFVNNRLAWSRMGSMLCASGAFAVWRRDVVNEVGGFSPDFTCEDIEMTFRVTEKYRRERRPVKILALPNIVGMTEGPDRVSTLVSQRERWQRVILETVWHYRRMLLNPRYGAVGFVGMPFFVISECIGPLMQVVGLVSLAAAIVFRLLDWSEFLSLIGIQAFVIGFLTSIGVWLNDWSFRYYRLHDLARLLLIGPLDLFWYRPVLMYANAKGWLGYLRRDKSWQRFERNTRPLAGHD